MVKKLRKIGNSTGLVLDKATLELAGLREGDEIDVHVNQGSITLTPARRVNSKEAFRKAKVEVFDQYDEALGRLA